MIMDGDMVCGFPTIYFFVDLSVFYFDLFILLLLIFLHNVEQRCVVDDQLRRKSHMFFDP